MPFSLRNIDNKKTRHELPCGICRFFIRDEPPFPPIEQHTAELTKELLLKCKYGCELHPGKKVWPFTPNCDDLYLLRSSEVLEILKT